jgi:hypothetical protein
MLGRIHIHGAVCAAPASAGFSYLRYCLATGVEVH